MEMMDKVNAVLDLMLDMSRQVARAFDDGKLGVAEGSMLAVNAVLQVNAMIHIFRRLSPDEVKELKRILDEGDIQIVMP